MVDLAAVVVDLVAVAPREDGNMKDLAHNFLTKDEQLQVTAAVHRAEKSTSGEIVPMIVSRSHHYPVAVIRGAALFSLPMALLLPIIVSNFFWIDPYNVWLFLLCFIPLFLLSHLVIHNSPTLYRLVISPEEAEEEVEEEAVKSFFHEKLYKTEEDNGILLFISVLEKRVVVLADHGINSLIPQEQWDEVVASVTQGIRNDSTCESLCSAITTIGTILETHFPPSKEHDELHNLIIK